MTKCGKYDLFLSCQGSGIILSAVCAALPYLAVTMPVESSPTTLTQIMCYILQANFNGRFLPNPLPMTSALPGQTATATDTTRDTAQERAKCRCRERRGSRERGGGRDLWMPCAKPSKNKNQWRIFATMETYLVTALNLCIRCPSHDRLHSRSSSRGDRLD